MLGGGRVITLIDSTTWSSFKSLDHGVNVILFLAVTKSHSWLLPL